MSTTDTKTIERPAFVKDKHLIFLDTLRESGITNMYGAVPHLRDQFTKLSRDEAVSVLSYWMKTFAQRHPR